MIGPRRFAWVVETRYAPERTDRRPYARLRIWGSDKTSRMLRADLVPLSWVPGRPRLPGPRQVRAIIDYALGHGWQPEVPGTPFVLTHSKHGAGLSLMAFALVDDL
jgi:hypothetical protein